MSPASGAAGAGVDFSEPLPREAGRAQKPRIASQNALFHMWMSQGAKHFQRQGKDVDAERLKLSLKYKFFRPKTQVGSKVVPGVVRSTKKLNRGGMRFHGQVRELAA